MKNYRRLANDWPCTQIFKVINVFLTLNEFLSARYQGLAPIPLNFLSEAA